MSISMRAAEIFGCCLDSFRWFGRLLRAGFGSNKLECGYVLFSKTSNFVSPTYNIRNPLQNINVFSKFPK